MKAVTTGVSLTRPVWYTRKFLSQAVEMVRSASHEREQQQTVEQSVHTLHRPDEIVEAAACDRKRPPRKETSSRALCTGTQA